MPYLLAIGSAALYGAADFLGGLASRRADTVAVVVMSQLSGLVILAVVLPFLPDAEIAPRDLAWGAAAGLTGSAGVALLYRALAVGRMGVVAPTTALLAVIIPVVAGIASGERPAVLALAGIALALVAIVLVSQTPAGVDDGVRQRAGRVPAGIGLALGSGVAIGFFFLSLSRTSPAAGLWPLVASRMVSIVLFGVLALATARPLRLPRPVATIAIGGGALDMLANALYLIASRTGPLSVVVTLASLYPASTVALARVVLGERISGLQLVGIVCALAAVVLIVAPGQ